MILAAPGLLGYYESRLIFSVAGIPHTDVCIISTIAASSDIISTSGKGGICFLFFCLGGRFYDSALLVIKLNISRVGL